jgi:hypothetical protein
VDILFIIALVAVGLIVAVSILPSWYRNIRDQVDHQSQRRKWRTAILEEQFGDLAPLYQDLRAVNGWINLSGETSGFWYKEREKVAQKLHVEWERIAWLMHLSSDDVGTLSLGALALKEREWVKRVGVSEAEINKQVRDLHDLLGR